MKKKNIYYNKFEIEQMEKELMEEAKDFLCSIYNRSNNDVIENIYRKFNTDWEIINKTIIMKEKSCKTCKNKLDGIMVDQYGHRGEVHECSKNHLDIGNQYTHSCDMHEEKKEMENVCMNCSYIKHIGLEHNPICLFWNMYPKDTEICYPNIFTCRYYKQK